jgi:hypothetical protein
MSVDWNLVKKALGEVNNLPENDFGKQVYGVGESFQGRDVNTEKIHECILNLFFHGYMSAVNYSDSDDDQIMTPRLNDLGLGLLDVLFNKDLWNSVNKIVEEDGSSLDLESMRDIGLPAIFY